MKIVNKPIKVLVIFYTDGKIEPINFEYDDRIVKIDKVMSSNIENYVGNTRIVFVCLKGDLIFEIKYELASNLWYLFKK